MTQEELNKIVEQHQHWLKEDCEGWEGMKANLSREEKFRLGKVLDEPMTGYKKTLEGVVITAENSRRCNSLLYQRQQVPHQPGHDVLHSQYDSGFEYRLGQEIEIKDFNLMYNVECASGFHFFRTKEEAEEY